MIKIYQHFLNTLLVSQEKIHHLSSKYEAPAHIVQRFTQNSKFKLHSEPQYNTEGGHKGRRYDLCLNQS